MRFPVEVRRARMGNATFEVEPDLARALVPDGPFAPVVGENGKATIVIGFVDYADNDLGDYNEVLFSVMTTADADVPDGTYIWRLPVDQAFTCEAGQVMLGLPKTVEEIDIDHGPAASSCTLRVDGELALRLTLPRLDDEDGMPLDAPMTCHSFINGRPVTSAARPAGELKLAFSSELFELDLGSHPVGKELAGLGLPAQPTTLTWCDDWRATFSPPVPLG